MFSKAIYIDKSYADKFRLLRQPLQPDRHPDEKKKFYIFRRYIDVMMFGALIGFKYRRRKTEPTIYLKDEDYSEESSDAGVTTIPVNTVLNERDRLFRIYRLIMLNEDDRGLPVEERIDNAFRHIDITDKRVIGNMELMMSYVYGGVDILYEKFKSVTTQEEALDII